MTAEKLARLLCEADLHLADVRHIPTKWKDAAGQEHDPVPCKWHLALAARVLETDQ